MPDERRRREVSDAGSLRALTHPTRIALLETLLLEGEMTATEAAERVGESPSSCSFHLRQLARYGYVEEGAQRRGRSRPWRVTSRGLNITFAPEDLESELAATALGRLVLDRMLERYDLWRHTRGNYPRRWQDAAAESAWVAWMTPEELEALAAQIAELVDAACVRERELDAAARPPDALPVELALLRYPLSPPRQGD